MIAKPFSTYAKFVYPNAKFEAMGNPFIGEKELNSIIESKDIISFKETVNTLKDYNITGEDTLTLQKSLDNTFFKTVEMMKKDSSKKMNEFYDTYLEKFDIYLVKNELKKLLTGKTKEADTEKAILAKTKEFLNNLKDKDKLPKTLESYGFNKELIKTITEEKPDIKELPFIQGYMTKD